MMLTEIIIGIAIFAVIVWAVLHAASGPEYQHDRHDDRGTWSEDSVIPGETFKTFATRAGITEEQMSELLYIAGMLKDEEWHNVLAAYLAKNVDEKPNLLGDIKEVEGTKIVNATDIVYHNGTYQIVAVDPTLVTPEDMDDDDWEYFIRTPRVWKRMSGLLDEILLGIEEAYYEGDPEFVVETYDGHLKDL